MKVKLVKGWIAVNNPTSIKNEYKKNNNEN
jgi:hypothetical protein